MQHLSGFSNQPTPHLSQCCYTAFGIMMGGHAAASSQGAMVVSDKDHQKFNQWLKYNVQNASSRKHEDCKTLAALYQQCKDLASRKEFISRWLKAGGSRGDCKVLVTQEMDFQAQAQKCIQSGWITPGSVADLMKVDRANYGDNIQGYKDALCFLIQQNQAQHPPPGGVGVKEGIDYWTTQHRGPSRLR